MLVAADLAAQVVRTTGINWEAVAAIAGVVSIVMTVIVLPAIRSMRVGYEVSMERKIYAAINQSLDKKLLPMQEEMKELITDLKTLDTRVARLEGIEEGKTRMQQQLIGNSSATPPDPPGK